MKTLVYDNNPVVSFISAKPPNGYSKSIEVVRSQLFALLRYDNTIKPVLNKIVLF